MKTNEKLRGELAQRRKAVNRFCRMAAMEQDLVEKWLEDTTDLQTYTEWCRHERGLVAALNEWRQATDALFSALEEQPAR